jgi:hypothetical protein
MHPRFRYLKYCYPHVPPYPIMFYIAPYLLLIDVPISYCSYIYMYIYIYIYMLLIVAISTNTLIKVLPDVFIFPTFVKSVSSTPYLSYYLDNMLHCHVFFYSVFLVTTLKPTHSLLSSTSPLFLILFLCLIRFCTIFLDYNF